MKKMKIKEFAEVVSGATPKTNIESYWDGEYPWITPAEINADSTYIFSTERNLTEQGVQSTSLKVLKKGTVLLSSRAPIGKVAIAGIDLYCNQGFKNLVCNEAIVEPKYIYYWLKSKTDYLNSLGRGATFKEISKSIVEEIEIPIPEIEVQKKIVHAIDKCKELIDKRRKQILACDELIKSRFIEMFGDPIYNPNHWEECNISEIVKGKVTNGFFAKRDEYTIEGNVSVLGVANVVNRMYSNYNELPKTNASDKDIEKFELHYGEILFCRSSLVAEGIGKASIVPKHIPKNTLFECHVIRLPLNLEVCVPEYIQVLTTTDYFRKQIMTQAKTATMTTIGQDGILRSNVLLPPIAKQREFLAFVQQVDKLKFGMEQSLKELEDNFDSLMQRAFKGELF